jgi:hypothetical protein
MSKSLVVECDIHCDIFVEMFLNSLTVESDFEQKFKFDPRIDVRSNWTDQSSQFDLRIDIRRILSSLFEISYCHEMWLLIILRMRKPCINDKTIAKIMIIREEFYSKDVMWSALRYNTCSNHSHILIWRWIILIKLI